MSAQAVNNVQHVTTTAAIPTTTIPAPTSTATPTTTTATAMDSNSAMMKIEQQGDKEPGVSIIEEDEARELKAEEQEELNRGEHEGTEESQVTPCELHQFDWAMETDTSIHPVPSPSDFHPTIPSKPDHAPPKPMVTPSGDDATPHAHTLAHPPRLVILLHPHSLRCPNTPSPCSMMT